MEKRLKFYILDGTSLIYRSFYAIRNLTSSKGLPTNAIFGFAKMLQKFIREKKPDCLAIAFDAKGPTFRHEAFQDYKAQRKPMPEELVTQLPWIKDLVRAYRIPILEVPGFEADDAIGSLARRAKSEFDVFIVSPDKDILQLVDPHVKVIPNPAEEWVLDEDEVQKLFGVAPKKIPDLLALAGDSSDNIPGVPGIGLKSASLLLKDVQDLDQLFQESWTQKGKIRKENLIKNEETARFNRHLAALNLDAPIEISLSSAQIQEPDQEALIKIFQELEFRDLLKEVVPKTHENLRVTSIQNLDAAHEMKRQIYEAGKISLAISAQGDHPLSSRLISIFIATGNGKIYHIPFNPQNPALNILKEILQDPSIPKTGYDLKRTQLILEDHGLVLQGLGFDVMIASFLAHPAHYKNLQDLAAALLSRSLPESDPLNPEAPAQEAIAILELEPILKTLLEESNQKDLLDRLELPLIEVLADMEKTGIPLDSQQLRSKQEEFQNLLEGLEKKIHKLADGPFNINSPKELSKILFERLKLPPLKKTKTGYSTDAEVLTSLADRHEIIPSLLEYRQISKLKSTYVDSLPQLVNPKTHRLHTTFSQTAAETGRLASANPNLQNIPTRTPLGKKIRAAFVVPDRNSLLLSADYSQIELRVLAHLSEDPGLIQAFENDEDIHRWTAQAVFNVSPADVTEAMRSKAKVINFGITYGMGTYGLSKELGISTDEAQDFINQYHQRFPQVQNFINGTLENARTLGYVTTLLGRRRYLPDLKSPQAQIRQLAERMAINTPIQGTAADLIKMAMIRLHHDLKETHLNSKLVLQIHDELILIVPKNELEALRSRVKDCMENILPLKVKLKVDIHTGENWMEL